MKKFYLLLLFIPFVFFFYILVSGFTKYPKKTQINSDQDLRGYFVDAKNGDDQNSGKQLSNPWKTVEKINSIIFEPGDNIYFKRGTSYYHGLQINGNGTKDNPITVSAYGEGDAPKFTNTNDTIFNGNAVQINGDDFFSQTAFSRDYARTNWQPYQWSDYYQKNSNYKFLIFNYKLKKSARIKKVHFLYIYKMLQN